MKRCLGAVVVAVLLVSCPDSQLVLGGWHFVSVLDTAAGSITTIGEVVFSEDRVVRWYSPSIEEDSEPGVQRWFADTGSIQITGTDEFTDADGAWTVFTSTTLILEGPNVMTGESVYSFWLNGSFAGTLEGTDELVRAK